MYVMRDLMMLKMCFRSHILIETCARSRTFVVVCAKFIEMQWQIKHGIRQNVLNAFFSLVFFFFLSSLFKLMSLILYRILQAYL